jgi:hypothetical protein
MIGFRLAAQRPPDARRVTDTVVMRFDHVYEVDPALMTEHVPQQDIPAWDTHRIVASRWEHLAWMHDHFADSVLSGEEILGDLEGDVGAAPGPPATADVGAGLGPPATGTGDNQRESRDQL